ncbi:hypothetical protein [Pseudonocardia zijingensis]|jgi:hypothetical protein|uniref:Lipoprotein n=1 Tax=Pseudonocardia zijingensis TaxID=153376 RepID=A0ABN1QKA9_9PSEU
MTRSSRRGAARIGVLAAGACLATALFATGCTTTVGGAAAADTAPVPTEGPGSDPVAWADRLCEGVLSFAEPATSPPDYSRTSDLPAVQRTVSSYLNAVVTGAKQGQAQLGEVGAAPEPAGDEATRRAREALGALEEEFGGVKTAVDGMNPNDPEGFMTTLTRVETTISAVTVPNPLADLTTAPRLYRAAERSTQCQQLSGLAAAAPR